MRLEHCVEWCKLGVYNRKRCNLLGSLVWFLPCVVLLLSRKTSLDDVDQILLDLPERTSFWLCCISRKNGRDGKERRAWACLKSPRTNQSLKDIWEEAGWLRGAAVHTFVSTMHTLEEVNRVKHGLVFNHLTAFKKCFSSHGSLVFRFSVGARRLSSGALHLQFVLFDHDTQLFQLFVVHMMSALQSQLLICSKE